MAHENAGLTPEERADLERRLLHALEEVARLSVPDDHGSGARTARLAGLSAWETEVARLKRLLGQEDR